MINISMSRFMRLGLTPAMAQHLAAQLQQALAAIKTIEANQGSRSGESASMQLVRITEVHRESQTVHNGQHERNAHTRPRLAWVLLQSGNTIAVGDWALCSYEDDGSDIDIDIDIDDEGGGDHGGTTTGPCWIEHLFAPLTHIVRRDAEGGRHAVVSNVDTALLVMGLDLDYNPRRLERYLALVQGSGVLPLVVLTKADTLDDAAVAAKISELRSRIGNALEIVAVNALAADAATALAAYLGAGQTLVLLGSSGAGKSTLTNTLLGQAAQDTGAVREHDSRGKHTTTSRSLHLLPAGACVIDTPGVRTLRPDIDAQTLSGLFGDVIALAGQCRFRNCHHDDEPGCAVRAALHPDRVRNYHKLLREASRDTQTVLQRQRVVAQYKVRGRAARQRNENKKAAW
jgi:ribosome biogenesis GTPase / thiamine phosphate phosphatase